MIYHSVQDLFLSYANHYGERVKQSHNISRAETLVIITFAASRLFVPDILSVH